MMFGDLRHAGDLLTRNARKYRNEIGLIDGPHRFTWNQLNCRANQFAHALRAAGIRQGEIISLYARNCHEYVEVIFGAAKVGIAVATVNYRLVEREVGHILEDCSATALVFGADYAPVVDAVRRQRPQLRRLISIGASPLSSAEEYEKFLADQPTHEPAPERPIAEEDPMVIIYTSGTTGLPKGGVWWHKGTIVNSFTFAHAIGIRYGMKLILPAPLYATAGASMILAAVFVGATGVLVNFEARRVLELIQQERADYINLVPATINFCLNVPEFRDYTLTSLKTILYAGSVMPVPVLRRALKEFSCNFRQVFGMTETCSAGTVLEPWEHVLEGAEKWTRRLASCGREYPNVKARVVNEHDEDVSPNGEVGELIIYSEGNIRGYLNRPEASAKTIRDGWVYTGDCGWIDEDGYVYITDRKSDMIVSGALNIYPAEIESILAEHPAILESAIIGVPDEKWGETVKAIVVLRPGKKATAEEIIAFCKSQLASFKKPRSVEFVESLPRNLSGKILKRVLREAYWRGQERKV